MRFEVTIQERTQTFVFSEVQLPGTADLYSAIAEAEGYRDETLQLKEEVEEFKNTVTIKAAEASNNANTSVFARNEAVAAKNDTLIAQNAVDQQAAIVATNTQTSTQKAQEASTSAQEALTSKNQAQGIKTDVEAIAQAVDQDRVAVEQAKVSVDASVVAVDQDAQQVAADKALIQQLTLENQALRAENQILTDLSRDYNTQSANNAIGALQVNIGGTNGIDNILPVAQLMPGMGLNGVNFLVARSVVGATNFNHRGVLDRSLINRPRFDFDPVTRRPLGVLIEGSRTQLIGTSQTNTGFNGTVTTFERNGETFFRYTPEPTVDNEKIVYLKGLSAGAPTSVGQRFVYFICRPTQSTDSVSVTFGGIGGFMFRFPTRTFSLSALGISIISSSFTETSDGFFIIRVALNFTSAPTFFRIYANPVSGFDRRNCGLEYNHVLFSDTILSSPIFNTGTPALIIPPDNLTQNLSSWNQAEGTIIAHVRPNTKPHQSIFVASDGVPVQLVANGDDLVNFSRTQGGTGVLPVITPKSGADRFGNSNAVDRVFFDRGASDTLTDLSRMVVLSQAVPQTGTYRISFWGRSATGSNQSIRVRRGEGGGADSTLTMTSTWQLFSVDAVFSSLGDIEFSLMTRGTVTPQTCDIFLSEISIRRVSDELRLQADGTLTFTRSGVTQVLNLGGSLNTFSSYAISYAPNRVAACRNGGTVQEITTAGNINVTNISYAPDVVGASKHVFAQYFARAMSNLSMQGKTGDFKYGQEPGDFTLNQNLGELAFHNFQNILSMGVADQTLRIRGTGSNVVETVSRDYPFEVITLFTSGSFTTRTITGMDATLGYFPANAVATLTFNAASGVVWDVAIRPRLTP